MQISYITKDDFLAAFLEAFNTSITTKNIQSSFRATRLVLYNPESVISRLDPKPITPSPLVSRLNTPNSQITKTPQTSYDINQQSITIKNKIVRHENSSLTHMYNVIDTQARSMSRIAHKLVLLEAELKEVRAANEVLSKRCRAKKTCLQQGGSLSFQEAEDLVAANEVDEQIKEETRRRGSRTKGGELSAQRCSTCGNTGHNMQTCQVEVIVSKEDNSEQFNKFVNVGSLYDGCLMENVYQRAPLAMQVRYIIILDINVINPIILFNSCLLSNSKLANITLTLTLDSL